MPRSQSSHSCPPEWTLQFHDTWNIHISSVDSQHHEYMLTLSFTSPPQNWLTNISLLHPLTATYSGLQTHYCAGTVPFPSQSNPYWDLALEQELRRTLRAWLRLRLPTPTSHLSSSVRARM